jgi:hypothetical protein
MGPSLRVATLLFLSASSLLRADFTRGLSPAELDATGVSRLSDAERAALIAVVERYRSGKSAPGRTDTQASEVAKSPTPPPSPKASERARSPASPADELETTLSGELRSFSGVRSFALANGQLWQALEPATYSGPVLQEPAVILRPGILGTSWLKIPAAGVRVRVRLLSGP